MSIGYTREKLYSAVVALACSGGTLQDRLTRAYHAMHMLTPEDFPDDELRAAYARLVHALRPTALGEVAGTTASSPVGLRPDHAQASTEQLLRLYTDITRFEEQHYRSLSARDL